MDGSATEPAYTFSGDLNTGIYHPAADTIGFAAGGVDVMRTTTAGINIYYPLDAARILNLTSPTDTSINYITLTADNLKYPLINITMTNGSNQDLYLQNLPVTGIPTGQVNLITVDRTGTDATNYGSNALILQTTVANYVGLKRFADGIGYRFMSAMLIFNGTSWCVG
jgi:hypothetical protein